MVPGCGGRSVLTTRRVSTGRVSDGSDDDNHIHGRWCVPDSRLAATTAAWAVLAGRGDFGVGGLFKGIGG